MKTYEECDSETTDLIVSVMREFHEDLVSKGLTVSSVFVKDSDEEGDKPSLRADGLPVAATIKVTSLADRARGMADAKLTIDQYAWDRLAPNQRRALLDHELEHLELKTRKIENGEDFFDDLGRPLLKLRPHDWCITGFEVVAARHRESSMESLLIAAAREKWEQLDLWGNGNRANE